MLQTSRPLRPRGPYEGSLGGPHEGLSPMQSIQEARSRTLDIPLIRTDPPLGPCGQGSTTGPSPNSAHWEAASLRGSRVASPRSHLDPARLRQCRATVRLLELLQQKSGAPDGPPEGPVSCWNNGADSSYSVASVDTCASSQSGNSQTSEEELRDESSPQVLQVQHAQHAQQRRQQTQQRLQRQLSHALLQHRVQQLHSRLDEQLGVQQQQQVLMLLLYPRERFREEWLCESSPSHHVLRDAKTCGHRCIWQQQFDALQGEKTSSAAT
ncbi:hypothetical protein cyc_04760 [Cyclospora cayetanensis]|uniref:Uncharacterized protein n=1 Tax=Cyclospora cayetanensis TaxID=88456 RepID=A0A1D3CXZ4_9EIME|nr:hypothetical protein cyc_04760 [Cyclospora cayetanensis]